MCTCAAAIDEKLKPLNGRLAYAFRADAGLTVSLLMQTEKIVPRGKKPPLVIPTFCPFCGKPLDEKSEIREIAHDTFRKEMERKFTGPRWRL